MTSIVRNGITYTVTWTWDARLATWLPRVQRNG